MSDMIVVSIAPGLFEIGRRIPNSEYLVPTHAIRHTDDGWQLWCTVSGELLYIFRYVTDAIESVSPRGMDPPHRSNKDTDMEHLILALALGVAAATPAFSQQPNPCAMPPQAYRLLAAAVQSGSPANIQAAQFMIQRMMPAYCSPSQPQPSSTYCQRLEKWRLLLLFELTSHHQLMR